MKELLICALKRHGKPGTAGDLFDEAVALALQAAWPRSAYAGSPKSASRLLQGMVSSGTLQAVGSVREGGVDRPIYAPIDGYDSTYPMPREPDPSGEANWLNGKSKPQLLAIFGIYDRSVGEINRNYGELKAFHDRTHREFEEIRERHQKGLAELDDRVRRILGDCGVEAPQ